MRRCVCRRERVDEVLGYHPLRSLRPPFGHYMNSEKNFLPIYAHGVEKVVLVGCGADRTLSGVPRYPERLAVSRANGGL